MKEQLLAFMEEHSFDTLDDFRGHSLQFFTTHAELVRLLQTLLVRKRTLPGLVEELKAEIHRRRPAEPEPEPGEGEEPSSVEVVEADTLIQPAVIATAEELDSWLSAIREKLTGLLKSHKRIRIKRRV